MTNKSDRPTKAAMLLLHLSDLHFGPHSRFKDDDPTQLGDSLFRALTQAKQDVGFPEQIDLVLVTGDIAESGKRKEFEQGSKFLAALAGELGLERCKFVFVPGNHDISWPLCRHVEADQEEDEFDEAELRRRLDAVKLNRYYEFLHEFYGTPGRVGIARPLACGAFLHSFPELRLSVAALNSCERESHLPDDHLGLVSQEQAYAVMAEWRKGGAESWLKVLAVHHNPWGTTRTNVEGWREYLRKIGQLDDRVVARYQSDVVGFEGSDYIKAIVQDANVQLVLHGHHHAKDEHNISWRTEKGLAHVLSAGSLCLSKETLPADEPASVRLIWLDLDKREIRARSLIYDPRTRTDGEVRPGAFVLDPAERGGYCQRLDLPPSFDTTTSATQTPPVSPQPDLEAFLRTYRERLKTAFPALKLPLTNELRADAPVAAKLDDMYLPLRLAEGFDTNKLDLGGSIGPQELITRERRLFVRGPAGAGKTTWLKWTFRRLLEPQWNALPLILVLSDLARLWQDPRYQGDGRSIDGFLASWVAEHLWRGWDGALLQSYQGKNGLRPILLVDGWDEVGDLKEEIERKLLGFANDHPRLLLVITSRPYEEARPYDESFNVLDIQPLSDLEIEELSRRFFNRLHGEGAAIAAQERDRFLQALNRSKEARALARTALLLTMMLLIGRSGPLPEERHLLYEKCIEYLLIDLPDRREREGAQLPAQQWRPDDGEERVRVAAALAAGMQGKRKHQHSSSIGSSNELKKLLPGEWPDRRKSSFLAWLSDSANLLAPQEDKTLAFTHLSFQDYLAARHLNATIKEPRECIDAFRQRLRSSQWWESLRLWAALIDQQDPERLDAMLDASLVYGASYDDELCFAGALLADGLGSHLRFEAWIKVFCSTLSSRWLIGSDLCARSWAMSRQDDRKKMLSNALSQQARGASWPGWLRIQSVCRQAFDLQPELPEGIASRAIVGQLDIPGGETERAARRVLCGGPAIWPIDPADVGLLQLWPAFRRLSALRLQLAASCGASWSDLLALAPAILVQPPWGQDAETRMREWAREWAHEWDREWLREWARHWAQYWNIEQMRDQRWVHDWIQYWACGWTREWHYDQAREWAREWARYWGRQWEPKWASDRARYWAHEGACYWARQTKTELQPWHEQFAFHDLASAGRTLGRVIMAHSSVPDGEPTSILITLACRISLAGHPATPAEQQQISPLADGLDPLWPALARHLARCSSQTDRELLVDLAQNPEKREPPLSWGLRYIVRGDILLEDGRIVTLDQLTDEAALPRLPFLDEMPPEPEVHGDSESIGRR